MLVRYVRCDKRYTSTPAVHSYPPTTRFMMAYHRLLVLFAKVNYT